MDRPEQVGAMPGPWPVDVSLAAGAICCGSAPATLTVASALAHRDATEVCWKVCKNGGERVVGKGKTREESSLKGEDHPI